MASAKRRPNFSAREIEVLVETYKSYEAILNAKHRDANTNSQKQLGWERIASNVSAVGVAARTIEECRKKMTNIQSATKAKAACREKAKHQTGGGPAPEPLTPVEENILTTLPIVSVFGIENGIDTSAPQEIPADSSPSLMDLLTSSAAPEISHESDPTSPRASRQVTPQQTAASRVEEAIDLQRRQIDLLEEIRDLLRNLVAALQK